MPPRSLAKIWSAGCDNASPRRKQGLEGLCGEYRLCGASHDCGLLEDGRTEDEWRWLLVG